MPANIMSRHAVKVYQIHGTPLLQAEYQGYSNPASSWEITPTDSQGNALVSTTPEGMVNQLKARYGARFQPCALKSDGRAWLVGYILPPRVRTDVSAPATPRLAQAAWQALDRDLDRAVARAQAAAQKVQALTRG